MRFSWEPIGEVGYGIVARFGAVVIAEGWYAKFWYGMELWQGTPW